MPQGQARSARSKTIAIYQDVILYMAPDTTIVGIDAAPASCAGPCPIRAGIRRAASWCRASSYRRNLHRRAAGQLLHRGERRADRQGSLEVLHGARNQRRQSRHLGRRAGGEANDLHVGTSRNLRSRAQDLIYWGIANPTPNTRLDRHAGNIDAIPRTAPADLYSNSTVALDPATGKLAWYYQHLPGDDWDQDYTHERTLFRTASASIRSS